MCVNGLSLSGQKGCHGDLRASKDHIISCSFSSYINETHYQQSGSFFFFFFPKAAVSQERMGTEDRLGFHKDGCMHLI